MDRSTRPDPIDKPGLDDASAALTATFQRAIANDPVLSAMMPRSPSYRYWLRRQVMFCYNTTPMMGADGRWCSWIYRPEGPGRLTGKATQWRMVRKARHATRAKAKARALRLWREAAK